MDYNAHVKNGVIVMDEPVQLPEGVSVRIVIKEQDRRFPLHPDILKITGILPTDLKAREDHLQGVIEKHT